MAGINFNRPANGADGRDSVETICDVHRDMYHCLRKNFDIDSNEIQFLLERIETAFKMGKSMNTKLVQYKNNYDDGWWDINKKAWDWDELKGDEPE